MTSPRIGDREVLYKNEHQEIYRVEADFGAFKKRYSVVDTGHRAGIVVVRGDCVLLVRQYRLLIDDTSWEIPGGRVDEGETPEMAAVRECLEETGIHCLNTKPLIFYHAGLDTFHNPTYLFYCENSTEVVVSQKTNPQEVSGLEWVPLSRCIEMIFEGRIVDCFSIVALLTYRTLTGRS